MTLNLSIKIAKHKKVEISSVKIIFSRRKLAGYFHERSKINSLFTLSIKYFQGYVVGSIISNITGLRMTFDWFSLLLFSPVWTYAHFVGSSNISAQTTFGKKMLKIVCYAYAITSSDYSDFKWKFKRRILY